MLNHQAWSSLMKERASQPLDIIQFNTSPSPPSPPPRPPVPPMATTPSTVVEITSTTVIKPGNNHGRRGCQLITFDLPYLSFFYNQKILLYSQPPEDFDNFSQTLKHGLRLVLQEYYELAGRLRRGDDGVFEIEDDSDTDGVELSTAMADHISLADLTVEDSASSLKNMTPYNGISNLEGLRRPLLAVQLTRLKDGVAVGCAFNHAVVDGNSTWQFIQAWADLCKNPNTKPTPPHHDRTIARKTRVKLEISGDKEKDDKNSNISNGEGEERRKTTKKKKMREKVFRFSGEVVERIKKAADGERGRGRREFSTFQALAGHVWRGVTRARALAAEEVTVLAVFVDCRRRVEPPVPENYMGNLIQAVFTAAEAGEVAAGGAGAGAEMVRGAVEGHRAEEIERRNEEWERRPVEMKYEDVGPNCVAVGSSPRFKVYEVDFGWGEAESVRSGSNNRFDGMVYLYQGKNGGRSVDVEISLESSAMCRLENDPSFLPLSS